MLYCSAGIVAQERAWGRCTPVQSRSSGLVVSVVSGTRSCVGSAEHDSNARRLRYKPAAIAQRECQPSTDATRRGRLLTDAGCVQSSVETNRPTGSKGIYWKSMYVCSTMGPSVKVDISAVRANTAAVK